MNNLLKGLLAVVGIGGIFYIYKSQKNNNIEGGKKNPKAPNFDKITLNDFPTYAEYENNVRFKKGKNLDLLVVSNGEEIDLFSEKFINEKQLNDALEMLNNDQMNVFTKENKKRARKWLITNAEPYEEKEEKYEIKNISEKLKFFKEELENDMEKNMSREDFAIINRKYIPIEYLRKKEYKDTSANRRRPKKK